MTNVSGTGAVVEAGGSWRSPPKADLAWSPPLASQRTKPSLRLLQPSISPGYGFTAIIVAWLARGHPALVLLTAPLMGLILAGGDLLKISLNMPFRVVDVFSGLMLMCLIAGESLARYRVRWG